MVKVIILNDTRRDRGHIGCCGVLHNLEIICIQKKWQIIFEDANLREVDNNFIEQVKNSDVVLLNGEGTIHHNKGYIWFKKAEISKSLGKKVFLINTTWQANDNHKKFLEVFDAISVRESFSLKQIVADGAKNNVFNIPDLAFFSFPFLNKNFEKMNINDLAIIDSAINTLTCKLKKISFENKVPLFFLYEKAYNHHSKTLSYLWRHMIQGQTFLHLDSAEKISWFCRLISGRFHADCYAMMYGVPTLALYSNSWKVEGLMKDADLYDYYVADNQELFDKINMFLGTKHKEYKEKSAEYANNAHKNIKSFYAEL